MDAEDLCNLGTNRLQDNDYPGAIEALTQAILYNSDLDEAYHQRGIARMALGDYQSAIEDWNQLLHLQPDSTSAYYNRGRTHYYLGNKSQAVEDLTQALRINPNFALAYYSRANIYSEWKEYSKAKEDLSKTIALNPVYAPAIYQLGLIHFELNNDEEAIDAFTQVLSIESNDVRSYVYRGVCRSRSGDKQGAIKDWNQAIELAPHYPDPYGNIALVRAELGDNQGAINSWSQFIQLNSDNEQAYMNRGQLYIETGDYSEAIADFTQALQLDPNNIAARLQRSRSRALVGDQKGMIEDYERVLDEARKTGVPFRVVLANPDGSLHYTVLSPDNNYTIDRSLMSGVNLPYSQRDIAENVKDAVQQLKDIAPEAIPILDTLQSRGVLSSRSEENNLTVAEQLLQIVILPRADGLEALDVFWVILERLYKPTLNTQLINIPFSNGEIKAKTCAAASMISILIFRPNPNEYVKVVEELTSHALCFTVVRKYEDSRLFQAKIEWLEEKFLFQIVDDQTLSIQISPDGKALGRAILEQKHRYYTNHDFDQWERKNSRSAVDVLLQSAITNYVLEGRYDSETDTDSRDGQAGVPLKSFATLSLNYDLLGEERVSIPGPAAPSRDWLIEGWIINSPLQGYDSP